jgi:hypothetical protein
MKYTYEVIQEQKIVLRTDENGDVVCIPINEANSDYQRYLNPVEHLTEIPTP